MPLLVSAIEKFSSIVGKKPNCATFAKPTVGIVDDANNSADRPLLDGYATNTNKTKSSEIMH